MAHDTVPYFMERFRDAYTAQLENFAGNVLEDRTPPITIDDGIDALGLPSRRHGHARRVRASVCPRRNTQ